jgi:hypothetical protein
MEFVGEDDGKHSDGESKHGYDHSSGQKDNILDVCGPWRQSRTLTRLEHADEHSFGGKRDVGRLSSSGDQLGVESGQ